MPSRSSPLSFALKHAWCPCYTPPQGFLRRNVVLLEEEAAVLLHAADMDGDGVLTLIEWMSATVYIPEEQVGRVP